MEPWIILSVAAAAFQTLRFMLQKHLSTGALSAGGATLARFFYSAPFVAALALAYAAAQGGAGGSPRASGSMPWAADWRRSWRPGAWCCSLRSAISPSGSPSRRPR